MDKKEIYKNLNKTKNYKLQSIVSRFRETNSFSQNNILFVDGNNLFMRTFSSGINKFNGSGQHVGGIIGFLTSLKATISKYKPKETYVFFDGKNNNKKKRAIYSEYKMGRNMKKWNTKVVEGASLDKHDFFDELNRLLIYLYTLPVKIIKPDGFEADDSIAYICQNKTLDSNIIIMTTDKDFLQLVNDRIKVYNSHSRKEYDVQKIKEELSMLPQNIIYWRIMDGDKSDNIPGIKMFGLKTILKNFPFFLDQEIGSMENFYKLVDENCNDKMIKKISENKELIERNYTIMSLKSEDLLIDLKEKVNLSESLDNFWGDNCFYEFDFKKEALKDDLSGSLVGSIMAEFKNKKFHIFPRR